MSPLIPTNPDDLPVEYETIPEDTVIHGIIRDFKIAEKTDKKDNHYGVITWEVITPTEFQGRQLSDNYVGFQGEALPNMSDGERRRNLEKGIRFNRVAACVGIKLESVPSNPIDDVDV